jgi:hypothetical protein
MDMRKGPMKYVEGGTLKSEKDVGPPMGIGGVGGTPGDEVTRGISIAPEEAPKKKKKEKKKKKPVKKNMGGMMKYKKGGTVRGVGRAVQKKIRPAKMVKM